MGKHKKRWATKQIHNHIILFGFKHPTIIMVEQQQQVTLSLFCIMVMCCYNTFEDESSDNNYMLLVLHDIRVMIGISMDQECYYPSVKYQNVMSS